MAQRSGYQPGKHPRGDNSKYILTFYYGDDLKAKFDRVEALLAGNGLTLNKSDLGRRAVEKALDDLIFKLKGFDNDTGI